MAANNLNEQQNSPERGQAQNQNPEQGGMNRGEENKKENPQEGAQWDNYQTRSLSSEGEHRIEESDLLRADEVPAQDSSQPDSSR